MTKMLESLTQKAKALPVAQERARMSPERKQEQRNATLTALVAFAVGAVIIEWTPWPWWAGATCIAYGLYAFDTRLFTDFFKFVGQLARAVRNLRKEETSQ